VARSLLQEDVSYEVAESELELESIAPDADTFYTIRPITVTQHRAFIKQHTRPARGGREKVDDKAVSTKMLDYALVGWRGVLEQGRDVECTLENKLKLPTEIQGCIVQAAQAGQKTPEQKKDSFRQPDQVV
jgi:hypothetical protein